MRGLGEVTDIVEKEMYSFVDAMNGDRLTLRPENTAGVVRAVIEHNLLYDGGKRLFYGSGRCSATSGRRRAATAVPPGRRRGAGFAGPDVDAELILMAARCGASSASSRARRALELNSLGQPTSGARTAPR